MKLLLTLRDACFKSLVFTLVACLCSFCSQPDEQLKPEISYIKSYIGTYSGFLFPKESIILELVTAKRAKAFYRKDNDTFSFEIDYSNGIYDTLGFFKTEIRYFKINTTDTVLVPFKGGRSDFDSINIGLQNLKLSKTLVFGSNTSIRFSGIIYDTLVIDRTFQRN